MEVQRDANKLAKRSWSYGKATSENELLQVYDGNHNKPLHVHGTRAPRAAPVHLLSLLGKQVF